MYRFKSVYSTRAVALNVTDKDDSSILRRRARLSVAGIPWHIIQRGNNRAVCFNAEQDYRRYLDDLAEHSCRFDCTIHAYVLITNHVHMPLTPEKTIVKATLPRVVQSTPGPERDLADTLDAERQRRVG